MALFGKKEDTAVTPPAPATNPPAETAAETFSKADVELAQRSSFAAGREEGVKAGRTEGHAAGAAAERQRILEIQQFALPGQEELARQAIAAGQSVDEAKGLFLEAARQEKTAGLQKLKDQATPPAGTVNRTGSGAESFTDGRTDGGAETADQAALRAEFAKDPERGGFIKLAGGNEEEAFKQYACLRRAEENGLVRGSR